MKGLRFIKQLSDVMFWASAVGMVFSGIMMFTTNRPFRSSGCLFICMGMALAWANLEVWADKQMLLSKEAEIARETFRQVRNNDLYEGREAS